MDQSAHLDEPTDSFTRTRTRPPQTHTHLQHKLRCTHAHIEGR